MTSPAPPPPDGQDQSAVLDAVVALLLAAGTVAAVKAALSTLAGVSAAVFGKIWARRKFAAFVKDALAKAPAPLGEGSEPVGGREQVERLAGEEQTRARAAYLVAATNRLAVAYGGDAATLRKAWQKEDTLLAAHKAAVEHRDDMIALVLADLDGVDPDGDGRILRGWYADARPCPICLAVDGKNFDALKPPAIGWPGWVHPHCYCTSGHPHPEGKMITGDETPTRASNLKYGKGSKLWKYWTGPKGSARYMGSAHPWTTLRDALISEGVPAGEADGLATNIMMATPAGRALYAKHHGKKKREDQTMNTETRTAEIVEVRGPGTDKPNDPPGFTAKLVNYNVPDSYRTSWTQGVFTRALEKRAAAGNAIPVVWNHDWADPIGQVVAYRDEADAFYGDVEFDDFDAVPRARQAYAQMKPNPRTGKATMGQFSFAFERGEEREDPTHRGVMQQTEVRAVQEFSLVLNGAVPGTGTIAMRADAAPAFEFRALTADGTAAGAADPLAVLAAVDAAMSGVAGQLEEADIQGARRYFSDAASRLSDLLYLLGQTPTVAGYDMWREDAPGEQRGDREAGPDADRVVQDTASGEEVFVRLDQVTSGARSLRVLQKTRGLRR